MGDLRKRLPERKAQVKVEEISYFWDRMINAFVENFLRRTLYCCDDPSYVEQEKRLRFLARESRYSRRMLSFTIADMMAKTPSGDSRVRVVLPRRPKDPYYAFLILDDRSEKEWASTEGYRQARMTLLEALCLIVKLVHPDALDIIGLATESHLYNKYRSEDLAYYDARTWDKATETRARELQALTGFLTSYKVKRLHCDEYPGMFDAVENDQTKSKARRGARSIRNSLCSCGSGKKYKRCCGGAGRP